MTVPDPFDTPEWRAFAGDAAANLLPKVGESAINLLITPATQPDIKFLLELGAMVWYGKPIVLLVREGQTVPPGLRRVATSIVAGDLSTDAGQALVTEALTRELRDLANPDGEAWT
jgi:hypothetical protein